MLLLFLQNMKCSNISKAVGVVAYRSGSIWRTNVGQLWIWFFSSCCSEL